MDNSKLIATDLLKAKENAGSWHKLSALIGIPAGTLWHIAKSNGSYLPKNKKYLLILGVKKPARKASPGKTIATMSKRELVYLFDHRLEM
jgi:hypothetical protein